MAKHNCKRDACEKTSVPNFTGRMWQGKKMGKICSKDPEQIRFAQYVAVQMDLYQARERSRFLKEKAA